MFVFQPGCCDEIETDITVLFFLRSEPVGMIVVQTRFKAYTDCIKAVVNGILYAVVRIQHWRVSCGRQRQRNVRSGIYILSPATG
jgi:hypothetical protein